MLLLYSMVYPGANFNHALCCTPFTLASQLMSAHVTTIGEHHLSPMLAAEASIMPLNDPVAKVSRLSLHVAQVSHMKTILMLLTPCYDKHALRADAPIPRMFFSPLVL